MTEHIIWAVIWFVLFLASSYGGLVAAWVSGVAALIMPNKAPTGRRAVGAIGLGILVFVLGVAFALFSLLKAIIHLAGAFGAA